MNNYLALTHEAALTAGLAAHAYSVAGCLSPPCRNLDLCKKELVIGTTTKALPVAGTRGFCKEAMKYCILAYFNNFYFCKYSSSTLRSNSFPVPWAACVGDRGGWRDKGGCWHCSVLFYFCMMFSVAVVWFLLGEN